MKLSTRINRMLVDDSLMVGHDFTIRRQSDGFTLDIWLSGHRREFWKTAEEVAQSIEAKAKA